jgi:hypothetical protein
MDAPAGPRSAWQAWSAPLIGLAAAIGVLSSQTAPTAILAIALLGAAAGYCFSVSLRLAIVGLSVALSLVIAQGLFLAPGDAWSGLLFATIGGLTQTAWSLLVWLFVDRAARGQESGWSTPAALTALRSNLTMRSPNARHAIRFGLALAVGVALYRLLDEHQHGFWIPLTILFVMRPQRDETYHRLALRAIGTVLGLIVATALAEAFVGDELAIGIVLTIAAALTFGLLTVQYALFTAAITTYVVILSVNLGEGAFHAAGQRAGGTLLGILIAAVAFVLWPNPGEGKAVGNQAGRPNPTPPEAPAR